MKASGLRDKLVTLQTAGTPAADGDGGYTTAFTAVGTAWASIEPVSQRALERLAPGTVIAQATHTVTFPYFAGLATTSRVTFEGRRFDVQAMLNPREANRELILVVSEQVS